MAEKIILTKEGLENKRTELKHLLEVVRPDVINELVEARNQGDLSENADYDAARNRQAEVEAKIKEIETMIENAQIIDEFEQSEVVTIGSTVTFEVRETKKIETIQIVGAVEANPFKKLISNEAPLVKAMLGKNVGEVVEVREVKVPYKITIKEIK